MEDSSSESHMEEGSIDGSEHEYEEYDIEGVDDEREDEFDEGPDDEDDDDMDDEDSGDGHDVPLELRETMSGVLNQFRFVNRVDAPGSSAEIHFTDFPVDASRGALGVLTVEGEQPQYSDDYFHNRVRETAAWLTAMDSQSFLNFVHNHALPVREAFSRSMSRGGPFHHDVSVLRDNDPSHRVHPALSRPRSPSSSSSLENFDDAGELPAMEMVVTGSHLIGSSPMGGGRVSIDIRSGNPQSSGTRSPDTALDDAFSSLASLACLISPDVNASVSSEGANGPQRTNVGQSRSVASSSQPSSAQPPLNEELDEIMPAAQVSSERNDAGERVSELRPRNHPTSQSMYTQFIQPFLSRALVLPSQAADMEMPWDGPGVPLGSVGPLGSIMRRSIGARMPRERDRSSTTRRWTYDPPGSGGDDLPSMFTGEPSNQRNQHGQSSERRDAATPFPTVAAESFEPVNRLEVSITSRLASLATELRKIDSNANKEISDARKRKEREEKKKKEEEEAKAKAAEEKVKAEAESRNIPKSSDSPAMVDGPDSVTPEVVENRTDADTGASPDKKDDDVMQTEPDAETLACESGEGAPGTTAPTEENGSEPIQAGTSRENQQTSTGNEEASPADATSNAPGGNTNDEYPSVAAARAAAIGISLDAPANDDPSVVAAALESTGIDPTFLSALPEEMRSDVFNQLFETMRNAPASSGSSEQQVTTLNQDFLIALPPVLRAEVLEAEADYQARAAAAAITNTGGNNADVNNGPSPGPGNQMDNATFLATLTPDLREEILLTSGEEFIASLPPAFAAEARTLREREAANHVQHHGWGSPDESPIAIRREYYGSYGSGSRRDRDGRGRREEPGMRWEKIDDHWYRIGPKDEDDVKSSLNDDALKSVIQLLKLSKSSYGKSYVHQVLASACKNSKSRTMVLRELLMMITQVNVNKNESLKEENSAIYASEGTVVRRALELLSQLCKSDVTVAEALIGLPTPTKQINLDEVGVSSENSSNKLLSLSTLTSLLSSPLFTRSNIHLEQLLSVIGTVCRAFPPARLGRTKRGRSSGFSSLLRSFGAVDDDGGDEDMGRLMIERFGDELAHGHPEGLADEDGRPIMSIEDWQMRDRRTIRRHRGLNVAAPDSDDSSEDEREGEAANSSAPSVENPDAVENPDDGEAANNAEAEEGSEIQADQAQNENVGSTNEQKPKKKKKSEVRIGVEYRVPQLSENDLNALVVVLRRSGCTDWVYEQVSSSLGHLGELPANRAITIASLAKSAQDLGVSVKEAYLSLRGELESCSSSADSAMVRKQIVSKFAMGSYSCELMLLRLVKTAATLLNLTSKKEKPNAKSGETNQSEEMPREADVHSKVLAELRESKDQVFCSLQELWVSLYEVLDLVESELDMPSQDRKKGTLRRGGSGYLARRRNEGLARQTRTRNSRKSLSPVLARLSPIIEAFFVAHSTLVESEEESSDPHEMVTSPRPLSPRDTLDSPACTPRPSDNMEDQCETGASKFKELGTFLARHRVPVNCLLRANPQLLETSFKMALKHPQTIDFDNKQAYFRSLIRKRSNEAHASTLRINVRREYVYNDSYHHLRGKTKEAMKGRLHVQFNGEEGIDAGGVTREWYAILARQIFDPNYALFCRSAAKAATYMPDKRSYINDEHLENFKFVGRFVAKAIYDGQLIDAYFTRAFYKHILGIKPTYRDIEAQDPDYFNSLKWMLENDITGVLDHSMSAEYEEFGQRKIVDLIPNGRNVPVTEENKAEYVRAVTEVRLTKAIEKQIEAFKTGFHELIPLEDCKIFNELELELLMSGLPDIDVADLKANMEYTGYTSTSPQINWFWRCVSQMDQEDLARLVMFVTGTSKVPLEGFSALQGMNGTQKFQIHRVAGDTNRLPSAHTCFNQLDLPEYASAETLSEQLLKAVRECNVGFGFA